MVGASLLSGCDTGVVVRDGDPTGVVTAVPLLPELVEGAGAWASVELEEGGCLVVHWAGGTTHSLELWGGLVFTTVVLTVVLGK